MQEKPDHRAACRCTECQPGYLAQRLAAAGERLTSPRQTVWNTLAGASQGLPAAELASILAAAGVGQATVYRTLELLTRLGLARLATLPGGRTGYLAVRPSHSHALICDCCGLVQDFEACSWNVVGELLELKTGFKLASHYLEVHGLCPGCQRAT
jgi:Fe2+ or Zn2+ uptake regulation protein